MTTRIKRIIEDLEADLYRVPEPRFFRRELGELERKRYADGSERLTIRVHCKEVPNFANIVVTVDGETLCELPVEGGRVSVDLRSENGDRVPVVRAGQVVDVNFEGRPIRRGKFRPD